MSKEVLKADLHVHSRFSPDSLSWVWQIEKARQERGLDWVAVTDHNAIAETARDLREKSGAQLILGEEILTSEGREIIGLFLQEPIEQGLGIPETVIKIGNQGGIVVIPHPYEIWRHGAGEKVTREIVIGCKDFWVPVAIEVFNARARSSWFNHQAMALYHKLRKEGFPVLATAGSDAHRISEIGRGHVIIPPFETKEELVEALRYARVCGEVNAFGTLYHRLLNRIELALGCSFFDLKRGLVQDFSYR